MSLIENKLNMNPIPGFIKRHFSAIFGTPAMLDSNTIVIYKILAPNAPLSFGWYQPHPPFLSRNVNRYNYKVVTA